MTKFRITFDVNADVITNCFIESTKGCPQCDEGASQDDQVEDHLEGDGVHVVEEDQLELINSTKSDRVGAASDSRS